MFYMAFRLTHLQQAIDGYRMTGIPFVGFDGKQYISAGYTDDLGLYYLIPKLVALTDWNLDRALVMVFMIVMAVSVIVGIVATCFLLKSHIAKILAIVEMLSIAMFSYLIGDHHFFACALAISVIPTFLYMTSLHRKRMLLIFLFFVSILLGLSHYFRSYSGTAILLFIAIYLIFDKHAAPRWRDKAIVSLLIVIGYLLPAPFFNSLIDQRNAFLQDKVPPFLLEQTSHPFWHTAYIGFGYLSNTHGLTYSDEIADAKVKSIAPEAGYLSIEYDKILKSALIQLFAEKRFFVISTVSAKIGVIFLCYFLFCANLGFLLAWFFPHGISLNLAFLAALCFSALPGIVAIPIPCYLLGFMAIAMLFGLISIDNAFAHDLLKKLTCWKNR